jgi:hypothetical protein
MRIAHIQAVLRREVVGGAADEVADAAPSVDSAVWLTGLPSLCQ